MKKKSTKNSCPIPSPYPAPVAPPDVPNKSPGQHQREWPSPLAPGQPFYFIFIDFI